MSMCAPMCSEALSAVCATNTCTNAHVCTCRLAKPAPATHVSRPADTQAHTCLHSCQIYGCEHTICTLRHRQQSLHRCCLLGTESQPTGPTRRDMKQTGSPRLHASPRLVSTTVRATHSCCQDTGSHCAARPRGTMRACFLLELDTIPLPTTLPVSRGAWEPSGLFQKVRETPLGP